MDYSKLKKRPSYPMETIAVAIAFSPRLDALLSETSRIRDYLKASLIIIHVGAKTSEKEELLDKSMEKAGIAANHCRVIWMEGDPVETILNVCKLNIVDLLILGALQKENILKFYLGSVARTISRKAKTSVLLITQPNVIANKIKKVIVNGVDNPKTPHTINTALYLTNLLGGKELTVVTEVHNPTLAMTMADSSTAPEAAKIRKDITEDEASKLTEVISNCQNKYADIKIKEKIVHGKHGHAISTYARSKGADLLVVNSPDIHLNLLDRIFTHDIEYILQDLPCNALIVHSRL